MVYFRFHLFNFLTSYINSRLFWFLAPLLSLKQDSAEVIITCLCAASLLVAETAKKCQSGSLKKFVIC